MILACFPQLPAARCAEAHTDPTDFVPNSYCTKCFLLALCPGWQVGGKPAFFRSRTRILLQAKPILSYNSTVFTPSLVQHQSRQVTVSNRYLHSRNATKHSVIVEVTIAHLSCPIFSPLSKQSCAQRHLYTLPSSGSLFSQRGGHSSLAMQHS